MAEPTFESQESTALFLGHLTRSVLAKLPTARVEWALAGSGVSVTVTWHEPERPRSIADPPRGGSYTKAFGAVVDLKGSVAATARREARLICKELTDG